MTLYNIDYIRDCTNYNKLVNKLAGRYCSFDDAISSINEKILNAVNEGKTEAKFGFLYKSDEKKKYILQCIEILIVVFGNLGYRTEMVEGKSKNETSRNCEFRVYWD